MGSMVFGIDFDMVSRNYPFSGFTIRFIGYGRFMAPRSIWNGTIAFGLVRVPIKLYSAIDPKGIAFREIHTKDGSLLKHRLVCKAEGKVVERSEVARGFEVRPDKYVLLDADEIKAVDGAQPKTIEIEEFVDVESIDPFHFTKTYYLGMRDVGEPYALLAAALEKTGRAGVGRFTFHNREYLCAIRSAGERLVLHTLRFDDEVIKPGDIELPSGGKAPTAKEVKLARKLVEGLTDDFEPGEFEDEYRAAVMDLIDRKAAGKKAPRKRRKKRRESGDLADALEKSLAAQGAKA
jgi:DNA end-binding protein Ku